MGKILAAYGGGFKPPTGGHFEIVKRALQDFPEIDEFTVFVGGKVRDGIEQEEAVLVWDIYKNYLANKVKIEPVKSPIGEILRLAKNNPQDLIYFVIGYREGRQDDLDDVAARTGDLEKKYPNIVVKVIPTYDPNMSGTNARAALVKSEEEFIKFLPPEVKEKSEIYAILRPPVNEIIKENITKAQLDSIEKYADGLFNRLGIDIEFTRHFLDRVNDKRNDKPISVAELIGMFKRLYKKHGKPLSKVDDDFNAVVKDFNNNINIPFAINVTDDDIEMYAKTVMRKKDFKTSTPVLALHEGRYDQEVLTQSRFIMNMFKAELGNEFDEDFEGSVENIFYDLELKFIPSDFDELGPSPFIINAAGDADSIEIVITYNPSSFPEAYNDLNAEIKDTLRHELEHFGQFNFDKGVNPGGADDLPLFDYLTLDYEVPAFVQGLYKKAKTKKITLDQAIDEFLDERVEELSFDESKKVKQIYLNWAKENLPKAQINENATYSKKIDLIQYLAELTQHMLDKGMNISPLPTLELIDGDIENASDFFGRTAYYDPNTQTIVLYTEGRHPKDIARSFAHEMIHHIQFLEDRLGDVTTTNTTQDQQLDQIEREAYLNGNMTFRNWTDSLSEEYKHKFGFDDKLGKDPFGLNQFAREIAEGVLNEGKYDALVTRLASYTLNAWKGDFKDGQSKGYFELEIGPGREFDYPHLFFNYKAKANFVDYSKSGGTARPRMKMPEVEINYWIDAEELPRMWEQISMSLRNVIRHEIEHLMQSGPNVKAGKEKASDYREREELRTGKKPWWKIWRKTLGTPDYYKLEKEVDANLQGLYLQAKKSRRPLKQVIDNYVKYTLNLPIEDQEEIKRIWAERAPALNIPLEEGRKKKKDPKKGTGKKPEGSSRRLYTDEDPKDTVRVKFSTRQDIVDTLNKKSFKAKSHARQSQVINLIHQRVRAAYNRAKDPKVRKRLKTALDYAEKRKEASKAKTQRLKKQKNENVAPNHDGKAAPFGSGYDKVKERKGFGGRSRYRAIEKRGDKYYYIQDNPFSPGIRQEFGPYKTKEQAKKKMNSFPPSTNYKDINEQQTYKIFSDMDGVITDFNGRFEKYSKGIPPSEYEKKFGKEKFWELADGEGVAFWVGMPWMDDGKKYWNYIKKYDVELLSSPSRSETSRLGKRLWVRNNLPGIKLTLAQAYNKRNYAAPNHILIDDRKSNIEQWRDKGGIGILHTSAEDTINQLKQLGL